MGRTRQETPSGYRLLTLQDYSRDPGGGPSDHLPNPFIDLPDISDGHPCRKRGVSLFHP